MRRSRPGGRSRCNVTALTGDDKDGIALGEDLCSETLPPALSSRLIQVSASDREGRLPQASSTDPLKNVGPVSGGVGDGAQLSRDPEVLVGTSDIGEGLAVAARVEVLHRFRANAGVTLEATRPAFAPEPCGVRLSSVTSILLSPWNCRTWPSNWKTCFSVESRLPGTKSP